MPNLKFWETPTFNFLQPIILRIESKLGRMRVWTIESRATLVKEPGRGRETQAISTGLGMDDVDGGMGGMTIKRRP